MHAPSSNKDQTIYFKYKGHGQGHKVIDSGFNKLSKHAKYEVSISYGSKVMAKVNGQSKFLAWMERSHHKECTHEI